MSFEHQNHFVKKTFSRILRIGPGLNVMVGILLAASIYPRILAQDIVLSDFEEANYVWLPGGDWTNTGTCFGSGPAQGTLPNQQTLDGYLGNGLVNTYLNGDGSTGTLTSPPFIKSMQGQSLPKIDL